MKGEKRIFTEMLLQLLLHLTLLSIVACSRSDFTGVSITPIAATTYGTWATSISWCPENTYATYFDVKWQRIQFIGDNTGANAIALVCVYVYFEFK
jgi:hypothetical protein